MKVAIIGSGFIARVHAHALKGMNQEIALVVDRNIDHAKQFANEFEVMNVSDRFEDCLKEEIDCIHICTPPTSHYEYAKKALEAKKHVVCEKPLCLDVEQAKELKELATKQQVVAALNFNVRYNDAIVRMHHQIEENNFGEVLMVHGSYQQQFHVLPTNYSWRYDEKVSGLMRATSEIGSHWFDLARYLTGLEIVGVSATYGNFFPERYIKDGIMYPQELKGGEKIHVKSDDAACITLRFSNGALGNVFLSEISHGANNRIEIFVNGTKQTVWWNSEHPYQTHYADVNQSSCFTNAFAGGFVESFEAFFKDVYQWILTKEKPERVPTFEDGYRNAAICQAVYDSANSESKWVEVEQ